MKVDYLIVGAGFAGSVLAERLARDAGKRVLLIDRRRHIGGNAYDCYNDAGILIHQYGPHIFHTNSAQVFGYLSRFTKWRPYEHKVLAAVDGRLVPIPINRTTINELYSLKLTEAEVEKFLLERAEKLKVIKTSEDVVLSRVGRELHEKFFRGYTTKQWGLDPSELDASVAGRIPVRTNDDDRYFNDTFQFMPLYGYTRMFENMLDHPNIRIELGVDYRAISHCIRAEETIFTGPIDEFFDYRFGRLPYRSLYFEHKTVNAERFQDVAVVNYPQSKPYTRITEYKHLTGQQHRATSLTYEYARDSGEPYYPIPRPENAARYGRYKTLADATPGVHFVGRLGTYKYYNMDQIVAQALATYAKIRGVSAWVDVA
ncbi:MAG: UDP-galactopyranose mutase [Candidatus Eremiobacteraeota bacterium]|nr:UDP-galactopyranose mutase [Candidatus Eremiobacteraeota bacterium]